MFEKTEAMKVYIILVLLEFGKPNAIHNYHLGMLLILSDSPFGLAHASLQGVPEMGALGWIVIIVWLSHDCPITRVTLL